MTLEDARRAAHNHLDTPWVDESTGVFVRASHLRLLLGAAGEYDRLKDLLTYPPSGWFPFGHHVDRPDIRLEVWGDEAGVPIWERPIPTPEDGKWSVRDRHTGAIYPQPNKLIAEKVAELHGGCEVVPGWPEQATPDLEIKGRQLFAALAHIYLDAEIGDRARELTKDFSSPEEFRTVPAADGRITIRHEGGNTLTGTVAQVLSTHLAKGWTLEAAAKA